ncbi:MAG: pyrimidine/purine nucleoside phosphorylase [Elusimicrobiota bacterium]
MTKIENVTVVTKANIYFDGKVVSHTVELKDGSKQTVGLIYQGNFHFTTGKPERMDITAGQCKIKLAGETEWTTYSAGTFFDVPGNSAFDIAVESGITEYICTYM